MLYIIRHGRTDWNDLHKLQGGTDIPLNAAGRQMAEEAREKYREIRARETAEILLRGRNIPILTDDRLREMGFGEYEGLANSFSIPDCPINILFQHPEQYTESIGGAETFAELFARTKSFLEEKIEPLTEKGKNVLIVGHGAMNRSIISQIRQTPIEDFWTIPGDNCEMIRLR